jgi:nickel-dependent lactate racemase
MGPVTTEPPAANIRFGAWNGDRDLSLTFPEHWEVELCPPRGGPDIGEEGVRAAFAAPVGAPRLRALAVGRRRPCIVIDDLSRPTPGERLVPVVLDELREAGISPRDVLLIAGVANHRPMTRQDLERKVGPEVLREVRFVNHSSVERCTKIGETRFGSPVEINDDFLASDLKILVGSIIPHAATGFSGGGKLLFPGIASVASAEAFHRGSCMRGRYAAVENDARHEVDEAARLAGVDFLVNAVPNARAGMAGLVTGDVVAAHRAGVSIAQQVFATPTPTGADIGVFSAYPKDGEFLQHLTAFAPWSTAPERIVREGGSLVVALEGSEGLGRHRLFEPGMPLHSPRASRIRGRSLAFFAPQVRSEMLPATMREDVLLHETWSGTLEWLLSRHPGPARVAVFPCATMQLGEGSVRSRPAQQ